ncbi:MAG: aldo/keto reductase [Vampirovibrionales bacterium]
MQQNTEQDAHDQMDFALGRGVNFFDAAEMYPVPPKAETQGRTETCIGSWFAARKNRDQVILATGSPAPAI